MSSLSAEKRFSFPFWVESLILLSIHESNLALQSSVTARQRIKTFMSIEEYTTSCSGAHFNIIESMYQNV
jgi:hypothetical protein